LSLLIVVCKRWKDNSE